MKSEFWNSDNVSKLGIPMTYLYRNGALIFMGRFLYPGAVIFMVVAFLYPVAIFVSRGDNKEFYNLNYKNNV